MRTPVKEPGPAATATVSTSSMPEPAFFSRSAITGISVTEWVRPVRRKDWAMSSLSSVRAADAHTADVSRARIFTDLSPPCG